MTSDTGSKISVDLKSSGHLLLPLPRCVRKEAIAPLIATVFSGPVRQSVVGPLLMPCRGLSTRRGLPHKSTTRVEQRQAAPGNDGRGAPWEGKPPLTDSHPNHDDRRPFLAYLPFPPSSYSAPSYPFGSL